jgi:tetratricopeptide (TPR) repeat protein
MSFFGRFAHSACFAVLLSIFFAAGCSKTFQDLYQEGTEAFAKGEYNEAQISLVESLEHNPNDVNALLMLTRSYLMLGKIPLAVQTIEKALTIEPTALDVLQLGGQTGFYAAKYDLANKCYRTICENAKSSSSDKAIGWVGLALVDIISMVDGKADIKRERARVNLYKAIRLDPRNASARYHLGVLYRDFGYNEVALDQFELFLRLENQDRDRAEKVRSSIIPAVKESIASARSFAGSSKNDAVSSAKFMKQAIEAWNKSHYKTAKLRYNDAYNADKTNYRAAYGLAQAWEKTTPTKAGYVEAFKYCKIACTLRPTSKEMLLKSAMLAAKAGNSLGAVESYSRALCIGFNDATVVKSFVRELKNVGKKDIAGIYQDYLNSLSNLSSR